MSGPSARTFWLVVAVWAVLFAPGAFRGDTAAAEVVEDTDRFAAAVIAPTFSADSLHAARPCRAGDIQTDLCEVVAGIVPAAIAMVVLAAGLSTPVPGRGATPLLTRQRRTTPPRAPPRY